MTMNPLLNSYDTPFDTVPFNRIKTEHFRPALDEKLAQARQKLNELAVATQAPTFENTIEAIEQLDVEVQRISSILFNLNSAETNDAIQQLVQELSPVLTEFSNDILLNEALFDKVNQVYQAHSNGQNLTQEQYMLLTKTYKSFVRHGAHLDETQKERFRVVSKQLAELKVRFSQHVLAENNAFELIVEHKTDLEGIPELFCTQAAELAKQKGCTDKWIFTLQYPSYLPFMQYAKNRMLREQMYRAFYSVGLHEGDHDNRPIIQEIVQLRAELAQLLGYNTYAAYVLEERMASKPNKVNAFLEELLTSAGPFAQKDFDEITQYANAHGVDDLRPWDWAYFTEKVKKERYEVDDEKLRPYFPLESVLKGAFEVAQKLFGLTFEERKDIEAYHADVQVFEVKDAQGKHVAIFYTDFFPREGKRPGAWMTSFRSQHVKNGEDIRPLVSIVCNFTPAGQDRPALLTFMEVKTLFHEFGHALHHMLSQVNYASLAGTHVYWDFVEFPSQLMENWLDEKECLDLFAKHYQTGETLPASEIEKLKNSKNFLAGYAMLRQVGLGMLDMAWHHNSPEQVNKLFGGDFDIILFEQQVLEKTSPFEPVLNACMSTQFSHIFAGGYAAGYYGYKWAEVLEADAYLLFKKEGIFNAELAQKLVETILSQGGTQHPMELYKNFRGKEPTVDALLMRSGLLDAIKA